MLSLWKRQEDNETCILTHPPCIPLPLPLKYLPIKIHVVNKLLCYNFRFIPTKLLCWLACFRESNDLTATTKDRMSGRGGGRFTIYLVIKTAAPLYNFRRHGVDRYTVSTAGRLIFENIRRLALNWKTCCRYEWFIHCWKQRIVLLPSIGASTWN